MNLNNDEEDSTPDPTVDEYELSEIKSWEKMDLNFNLIKPRKRKKKYQDFPILKSFQRKDIFSEPDFLDEFLYEDRKDYIFKPNPNRWDLNGYSSTFRNIFVGFFQFFQRGKRRNVRFPDEIVERAEQKGGETMGKEREVKRSQKQTKRLSSILYEGIKGKPENAVSEEEEHTSIEDEQNEGQDELIKKYQRSPTIYETQRNSKIDEDFPCSPVLDSSTIEEQDTGCCKSTLCCSTQEKLPVLKVRSKSVPNYSTKFQVTEQKLSKTLDIIEDFIEENYKTVQFTNALLGLSLAPNKLDNLNSSAIIPETCTRSPLHQPEVPPSNSLNQVAANVWLFTFAFGEVFLNQEKPTRLEFENLLMDFAQLATFADKVAKRTILYSFVHRRFTKEAYKTLTRAFKHLNLEPTTEIVKNFVNHQRRRSINDKSVNDEHTSEESTKKEITLGKALTIESNETKFVKLCTREIGSEEEWNDFLNEPLQFKLEYLNEVLIQLTNCLVTLNVQMRFLTDDILERNSFRLPSTSKNGGSKKNPHFLTALHSLDTVIDRFSNSKETNEIYKNALLKTVECIIEDVIQFFNDIEQIMVSIVEIRDMMELSYAYMVQVYGFQFDRILPKQFLPQFLTRRTSNRAKICTNFFRKYCCEEKIERSAGFDPEDFYKTVFPIQLDQVIISHKEMGYEFALQMIPTEDRKRRNENFRVSFSIEDGNETREKGQFNSSTERFKIPLLLEKKNEPRGIWDELSEIDLDELADVVLHDASDSTDPRLYRITEHASR